MSSSSRAQPQREDPQSRGDDEKGACDEEQAERIEVEAHRPERADRVAAVVRRPGCEGNQEHQRESLGKRGDRGRDRRDQDSASMRAVVIPEEPEHESGPAASGDRRYAAILRLVPRRQGETRLVSTAPFRSLNRKFLRGAAYQAETMSCVYFM